MNNDHLLWKILGAFTGLASLAVAVVLGIHHWSDSAKGDATSPAGLPPVPSSVVRTSFPESPETVLPIGSCLNDKRVVVSCDATHIFEVFAAGSHSIPCDAQALLSYLGGQGSVDTLLSTVTPQVVDSGNQTGCAVTTPDQLPLTHTLKNILDTASGDSWRRCVDSNVNREVACSERHTGEYIFLGTLKAGDQLDCGAQASQYLGEDFSRYLADLTVQMGTMGDQDSCVVSARGGNVLTASIRRVGVRAIPLAPA